ncbi:hypothetical protein [Nocardioides sambongensis]|uniref:hypothetical protein n=1 Tax=Nocardioides sambongensis TaxID=2589074 RepID=UPI001E302FC4|nr:hypothetical protein [Nocardioides sambongensis]
MADGRSRTDGLQKARRRFARRQWARRWLTWRYVLVAALLVGLLGLGVYGVYFSPWLRAEEVSVTGTDMLTTDEVLAAADVETGEPSPRSTSRGSSAGSPATSPRWRVWTSPGSGRTRCRS